MSNKRCFSVIITTYNRAELLIRALNSLINQTFTSWEAILIDDGSTDNTHSLIKSFLKELPNITYHFQENQGIVKTRNRGISLTNGKYITFLDSDDEYLPHHLESRHSILQTDKTIDFLHGGVEIIGDTYVPDRHDPSEQIHLSKCAISGSFVIKQDVLKKLKGFRGDTLGMDADLLERAERENAKVIKIEEPRTYIYHRENPDSFTHHTSNEHSI